MKIDLLLFSKVITEIKCIAHDVRGKKINHLTFHYRYHGVLTLAGGRFLSVPDTGLVGALAGDLRLVSVAAFVERLDDGSTAFFSPPAGAILLPLPGARGTYLKLQSST
jgi:hypothetical protein